jgi:replicative DNA helicase
MSVPDMWPWFAKDLTRLIGPILRGRLYVVLASTGAGKTLFTLNIVDWLLQLGLRLLVVPTEESSRLHTLLACRQANVSFRDFHYRRLDDQDVQQVEELADRYRAMPGLRLLPGSPPFAEILDGLKAWPADLLVIDHVHLLSLPGRSEPEGLDAVMVWMQKLADVLEMPIIAMVQVHRPVGRDHLAPYRIPSLYSGRGSSKIEQSADVVLGLSRKLKDDVDAKTMTRLSRGLLHRHESPRDYEEPGVARVSCLKHRLDDEARSRSVLLTVHRGKLQDLIALADGTTGEPLDGDDDGPPF